ncbi:DNA repair protein RAD50-like [Fagus crenata]
MAADSEDRVKLSLKKAELENHKKKHKKIIDEYKDRIRGVLKGRLPLDKDLKKEITQALRPIRMEFDDLNTKSHEAEKDVNMLQIKIEEVNNNLSKYCKDMECNTYRLGRLTKVSELFEAKLFHHIDFEAHEALECVQTSIEPLWLQPQPQPFEKIPNRTTRA